MKKLMKAIAFATVMCMLLSTAAFAVSDATVVGNVIDVVVDAPEGAQVALLMLVPGTQLAAADNETILFIDQQTSKGASAVTFDDVNIGTATAADVYIGYDGNLNDVFVEKVTFEAGDTITVSVLEKFEGVDGDTDNDLGGGYLLNLVKNLETGRSIKKLIWAIDWTKKVDGVDAGSGTSYITLTDEELVDINLLEGNTNIGVAFAAGAKNVNSFDVVLGDVRAIWKTAGADLPDKQSVVADKDLANKSN